MAQRRTRFVVVRHHVAHTQTKQQFEVLAYNEPTTIQRIKSRFSDRDWVVTSVERKRRGETTKSVTHNEWEVDEANLKLAISELGIKFPVHIKLTGHRGGRYGAHFLSRKSVGPRHIRLGIGLPDFYHHITVKNWQTTEYAGQTIWHELRHAEQSERTIRELLKRNPYATLTQQEEAWTAYAFQRAPGRKRGAKYKDRHCEIEATATEKRNDEIPLARKL